jgi:hypothetical protein
MGASFSDAKVDDYGSILSACGALPDKDDAHVVAAALKTRADLIVTDNLKDFTEKVLAQLGLDVRSADPFIAGAIMLDTVLSFSRWKPNRSLTRQTLSGRSSVHCDVRSSRRSDDGAVMVENSAPSLFERSTSRACVRTRSDGVRCPSASTARVSAA